jgi:hypothetical protein
VWWWWRREALKKICGLPPLTLPLPPLLHYSISLANPFCHDTLLSAATTTTIYCILSFLLPPYVFNSNENKKFIIIIIFKILDIFSLQSSPLIKYWYFIPFFSPNLGWLKY